MRHMRHRTRASERGPASPGAKEAKENAMSDRRWTDPDRPFRIVTRITRDVQIPLWEGADMARATAAASLSRLGTSWRKAGRYSTARGTTRQNGSAGARIISLRPASAARVGAMMARASREVVQPCRRQYRPPAGAGVAPRRRGHQRRRTARAAPTAGPIAAPTARPARGVTKWCAIRAAAISGHLPRLTT
jgi:hypothetical protein